MVETKTKSKTIEYNEEYLTVVLVSNNPLSESTIAGKKVIDWMTSQVSIFDVRKVSVEKEIDYLSIAKKTVTDSKYVLVLPATCPLLLKQDIMDILDYAVYKEQNVVKLEEGYLFATHKLDHIERLYDLFTVPIGRDRFYKIVDQLSLSYATTYLRNKINNFHMRQGVRLIDPATTYIDSNVVIGNDVVIAPNVILRNETVIGDGCYIGAGCVIDHSTILRFSVVHASHLTDVLIKENSEIEPYTVLKGKTIYKGE